MVTVRTVVAVALLAASTAAVPGTAGAVQPAGAAGPTVSAGPAGPVGPAGPAGSTASGGSAAASPTVVQEVVYRLTPERPGSVRLTMRYDVGANASTLVVYEDARATVLDARGFDRQPNGRWIWNESVAQPSLTRRVAVNRSGPTFDGYGWVDVGDWALVHPRTAFAYYSGPADRWVYSWRDGARIERERRVEGEGFAGASVVYFGPHERRVGNLTEGTVRFVRPAGATGTNLDRVRMTLANASRQLRVGARDETLNVFLGPDPLRPGGITADGVGSTQDAWVAAGTPVRAPRNVWVHEYVHTRQAFTLTPRMAWFREASATYYAGLLSVRQGIDGRQGYERFRERLHGTGAAGVVLTDATTWADRHAPYDRGARVLAALDARIRDETGGNRTLQAVVRRLNARDGPVTYEGFVAVVANVSGTAQGDWLDARVAGDATVSPPVSPYAYTSPRPGTDADGDGLADAAERAHGTHPFDPDTDDDGVTDGVEVANGTDSTDPDAGTDRPTDAAGRPVELRPGDPDDSGARTLAGPLGDLFSATVERLLTALDE